MDVSDCFDDYWKLKHYDSHKLILHSLIQDLGYVRAKPTLPKERLSKIVQRRARGLLCYDRCTHDELKTFIAARNIQLPKSRARAAMDPSSLVTAECVRMIKKLEAEDEKLEFNKFLDLPPELRSRIYELYDAEFALRLKLPTTPPLGRTCRLVREELLPLFSANHTFYINLAQTSEDPVEYREAKRLNYYQAA